MVEYHAARSAAPVGAVLDPTSGPPGAAYRTNEGLHWHGALRSDGPDTVGPVWTTSRDMDAIEPPWAAPTVTSKRPTDEPADRTARAIGPFQPSDTDGAVALMGSLRDHAEPALAHRALAEGPAGVAVTIEPWRAFSQNRTESRRERVGT